MIYADIKYSKELKDEFKDSEWWWYLDNNDEYGLAMLPMEARDGTDFPALTTDMLLERLPKEIYIDNTDCHLELRFFDENGNYLLEITHYFIRYIKKYDDEEYPTITRVLRQESDKSLPNALAKMLIWLKKENLL